MLPALFSFERERENFIIMQVVKSKAVINKVTSLHVRKPFEKLSKLNFGSTPIL